MCSLAGPSITHATTKQAVSMQQLVWYDGRMACNPVVDGMGWVRLLQTKA